MCSTSTRENLRSMGSSLGFGSGPLNCHVYGRDFDRSMIPFFSGGAWDGCNIFEMLRVETSFGQRSGYDLTCFQSGGRTQYPWYSNTVGLRLGHAYPRRVGHAVTVLSFS